MTLDSGKGHSALRRGGVSLPHHVYSVTIVTSDRLAWFQDFQIASKTAACFERQPLLGDAAMLAWVLMPDHAHWLIQLDALDTLPRVVSRVKAASARAANEKLTRQGKVWQRGYYDHALRREEDLRAVARYIVANPIRAGLVEDVRQYPFWNATWL